MRVLVACEESGVVRDAFLARGHDAWSNDLQPARNGGPHLWMDCEVAIMDRPWDIIIFHPDCTAMAVCGNGTYGRGKLRHIERERAWFFSGRAVQMVNLIKRCARVGACMENPASTLWAQIGEKPHWIQPNMFGPPGATKETYGPLRSTVCPG